MKRLGAISLIVLTLWAVASLGSNIAPRSVSTGSVPWLCAPASASTTAYACTPTLLDGSPIPLSQLSAPGNGQELIFIPDVTNSGAITIKIDGTNARGARFNVVGGQNNFQSGDLTAAFSYNFNWKPSNSRWISQSGVASIGFNAPLTNVGGTTLNPNFFLMLNGQQLFTIGTGTPPSLGACGGTPSLGSQFGNNAGTINVGSGVTTSCVLNFGTNFSSAPSCTVSSNSTTVTTDVSAVSVSSVTFSFSATLGGGQIYWHCF